MFAGDLRRITSIVVTHIMISNSDSYSTSFHELEPFWISPGLSRQPEAVEFLIARINIASSAAVHAISPPAPILREHRRPSPRCRFTTGSRELAAVHRTECLPKHDAVE